MDQGSFLFSDKEFSVINSIQTGFGAHVTQSVLGAVPSEVK
jgi:hypothetical protein